MNESELHPDDRVYLSDLQLTCIDDESPMERQARAEVPQGRHYPWRCKECGQRVSVIVPESGSELERTILGLANKETELHPDDGFSIATLGFYAEWPDQPMLRVKKETLATEPKRTQYTYRLPDGSRGIEVVVPHGAPDESGS